MALGIKRYRFKRCVFKQAARVKTKIRDEMLNKERNLQVKKGYSSYA